MKERTTLLVWPTLLIAPNCGLSQNFAPTALSTYAENNFFNKTTNHEPKPGRAVGIDKINRELGIKREAWQTVAAGVVAVWAREKVYDVVWGDADKRSLNRHGKLPDIGSTVDAKSASWTNTIGNAELIGVWKDPDFNPSANAFYYARVIGIPTPRWTTYDAVRFDEAIAAGAPMSIQERAYTSPIWYSAGK